MKFEKIKVADTLINSKGNVPMAMVEYIFRYGCNGFKCKKCPLGIVCDHYPSNSQFFASKVLNRIEKNIDKSN